MITPYLLQFLINNERLFHDYEPIFIQKKKIITK